uniref:hypothetical protein n=1 Tax=Sedimenticola sp. TaxID=1940285 RepID=UPI003D11F461
GKGRPSAEVVTPSFQSQRAAPAAPASAGGADRAPSAPAKVAVAAGGSQSNASFDDDDGWDEF